MLHFNKHFNHIITVILTCIILSITPIFANAQPVVDSPANVKLQTIIDWLNNFLVYHFDYYNSAINTKLYDITQDILAVGGQVSDVSSKLLTSNNYLSSIDSNTDYVETHLSNINNSLENIGWTNRNITYSYYQTLNDAVSQSNAITSNLSARHIYIRVNFTDWDPYNDALNLVFPVIPYFSNSVPAGDMFIDNVYGLSNAANSSVLLSDEDIYFAYNNYQRASTFYLDGIGRAYAGGGANQASRRTLIFDVTGKQNVYIFGSDSVSAKSLAYGSEDYLKLANYIKIQSLDIDSIESNIQTIVDVYASPDVIAAKENQQVYEDQAITDFTGSGNAAASTSDTTNMKNVSGAIKSGLDSGGSVNGALGVFNTSGGLWDWFSQANYNEINGTNARSRNRSNEVYIDFYNTNREKLEELLGEYR